MNFIMKRRLATMLLTAASLTAFAEYGINFPDGTTVTRNNRYLNSLKLRADGLSTQILDVNQTNLGPLYVDCTGKCFVALQGTEVTFLPDWTGDWMNGYVYLDRGNDGTFDVDADAQSTSDDLMAFSNYEGKNSLGASSGNANNVLNPPSFTIPADLKPGLYRMRFKIDWSNVDPGGATVEGNDIVRNGGVITDFMLLVPDTDGKVHVSATNGSITMADGSAITPEAIPTEGSVDFLLTPAPGYKFDGLTITSGFHTGSDNVTFVEPALNGGIPTVYTDASISAEGIITVAATELAGGAELHAQFIEAGEVNPAQRYHSDYSGTKSASDGITAITVNGTKKAVSSTSLHEWNELKVNCQKGGALTVLPTFGGNAPGFRLYIDLNHDGQFNENPSALSCELVASSEGAGELTATLPEWLGNGVYRARLEAVGHSDVDFLLNVHNATARIFPKALNGIILTVDGTPLPNESQILTSLKVLCQPTLPGYVATKAIIRHGQNLNGPEFISGNRQWADTEGNLLKSGKMSVNSALMDGDVEIYVIYEETEDSEWTKVWADEFNTDKLDTRRWQYQSRAGATWNRLVAQGAKAQRMVNVIEDGYYNSYCIPTPDEISGETQPMISGAINTLGKFSITYGKIECRLKTTAHTGNFPAFWMMPAYSELTELGLNGWPRDGEIDIWEQIDTESRAYHTVHTGWTGWSNYCGWSDAPKQSSPQSSSNNWTDTSLWHVYALEWDAEQLRWYVDGKQTFSYTNQHYSEPGSEHYIEKITWPFDKHFYIILNQSVGNGAWAKPADTSFRYLTQFDYVRVYQKKGENAYDSKVKDNGDDPNFYVPAKGVDDSESAIIEVDMEPSEADGPVEYYDLNGRRVAAGSGLVPGIYVEKQGSIANKIIVR